MSLRMHGNTNISHVTRRGRTMKFRLPLDLSRLLSSLHGKPLDLLYAFLVHRVVNRGSFFSRGWGDLRRVEWLQDRVKGFDWPPPRVKISWKLLENGERDAKRYRLLEGSFETPCSKTVWDALPPESRTSRVRFLMPTDSRYEQLGCVLHLSGTGDQGFGRRMNLSLSLLKHNVASMILESPYYGARRPFDQRGCRLRNVSDLLTLGRATIEESAALLYWAKGKGFGPLGVCGLSMGGVHSCMVAALYPEDLACSPLLAPRSAAVAFCEGALRHGITNWQPLASKKDMNNQDIHATLSETDVIHMASQRLRMFTPTVPEVDWIMPNCKVDALTSDLFNQTLLSQYSTLSYYYYPDDNISDETSALSLFDAATRYEALRRLQMVLEIFTDVTQFPVPRRPDAAIFVAATDDAYALPHSARELHQYWSGSELRWVPGGHVSAILFHARAFCRAINDSLQRLSDEDASRRVSSH